MVDCGITLSLQCFTCPTLLSLMTFVVDNLRSFQTNSLVHTTDTRNKTKLYRPVAILSLSCVGIKIFSSRTYSILNRKNDRYSLRLQS